MLSQMLSWLVERQKLWCSLPDARKASRFGCIAVLVLGPSRILQLSVGQPRLSERFVCQADIFSEDLKPGVARVEEALTVAQCLHFGQSFLVSNPAGSMNGALG